MSFSKVPETCAKVHVQKAQSFGDPSAASPTWPPRPSFLLHLLLSSQQCGVSAQTPHHSLCLARKLFTSHGGCTRRTPTRPDHGGTSGDTAVHDEEDSVSTETIFILCLPGFPQNKGQSLSFRLRIRQEDKLERLRDLENALSGWKPKRGAHCSASLEFRPQRLRGLRRETQRRDLEPSFFQLQSCASRQLYPRL